MKVFIHTISFTKHISLNDKAQLNDAYKDSIIWIADEKKYIMNRYNDYGISLKIEKNSEPEQKFDKEHHMFKMKIIVNLFKLLNPKEDYGMITEQNEFELAVKRLSGILQRIENETGVCLYNDLILKRIDVAKDVVTPNDEYTQEVIRLSKLAPKKYGYKNYTPGEKTKKKKWKLEDSSMFYSKSVNAKLYNKKQDLINHNIEPDTGDEGLLRFEVSLKPEAIVGRNYMNEREIHLDALAQILYQITCDGEYIIKQFFKDILMDGSMVSKGIQNKYIKVKYGGKKKRIKNMKEYRNAVNKGTDYDFTSDKAYRIKEYFETVGLSPLYSMLPYVPSFSDILDGRIDKAIVDFAYFKSEDKNQVFWSSDVLGIDTFTNKNVK